MDALDKINRVLTITLMALILFSFIVPFVSAAPPITTAQQFTEGYDIRLLTDNVLKENTPISFEAHVYNISTGIPIRTGIGCYFHLYNTTGSHVLELTTLTSDHNFDYGFDVTAPNITKELKTYSIQCNNSVLGGYREAELLVTPSGDVAETPDSIFFIGFIIIIGILIAIFASIKNNIVKTIILITALLMILIVLNISSIIIHSAEVSKSTDALFQIIFWITIITILYLGISLIIETIEAMGKTHG